MRLSTRSRYGVRLMLALAENREKKPLFLKEIASSEEMSEKYLSQIIIPLKAKGLVTTFRGAHGGYLLSRPAGEITLRDIIEPLEGDLNLVDCVGNPAVCDKANECATREVWDEMSLLILGFLESFTLADLIEKTGKIKNSQRNGTDYSI